MGDFKVINREYVPEVDRQVLSTSANILEEGHKEAVRTASELKTAIGQLKFNEAEDGFKQQLVDDIQQTITDNVVYGNAYSALDDLILKQGNLFSDPRVLGRLKANADFEQYKTSVQNNNQLSQLHKDYYLANNPYYYQDKVDNKTGRIIGGSTWKPISSPTTVVDYSKILHQAIQTAAVQSGNSNIIRYINANGQYTDNPFEAVGGQYADKTTVTFNAKTKEKIWQEVNALINTTPGTKESIIQDMNVYAWEAKEKTKENKGVPYINSATDGQGQLLSYDKYVHKLFDEGVKGAAYYNTSTNIDIGGGGAAYYALRIGALEKGSGNGVTDLENDGYGTFSTNTTPIEITTNKASDYLVRQKESIKNIHNLYKQLTGRPLVFTGENEKIIGNMTALLNKYTNLDLGLKGRLLDEVAVYNESTKALNNYKSQMTDNEKRNFDFANRVYAGGELVNSTNGGSKYDDNIISSLNELKSNNVSQIVIAAEDKYIKMLKDRIPNYRELGISFDNNQFSIGADNFYRLPLLGAYINEIEKTEDTWLPGDPKKRFNIASVANGEIVKQGGRDVVVNVGKQAANGYRVGKELENRINGNQTSTFSTVNFAFSSWKAKDVFDAYNAGKMDETSFNTKTKSYNDQAKASCATHDYSITPMYVAEPGETQKPITDSRLRIEYGEMIKNALNDKNFYPTITAIPNTVGEDGSPIPAYTFSVPKYKYVQDEGTATAKKQIVGRYTITVPNIKNNDVSESFRTSPHMRTFNLNESLNQTKGTYDITSRDLDGVMGDISIHGLGDNIYQVDIFGVRRNIDRPTADALVLNMMQYNKIKGTIIKSYYYSDDYYKSRVDQVMAPIISSLCVASGNTSDTFIEAIKDNVLNAISN